MALAGSAEADVIAVFTDGLRSLVECDAVVVGRVEDPASGSLQTIVTVASPELAEVTDPLRRREALDPYGNLLRMVTQGCDLGVGPSRRKVHWRPPAALAGGTDPYSGFAPTAGGCPAGRASPSPTPTRRMSARYVLERPSPFGTPS